MPNSDKVDSISFEAAASPDAERIAPLALYFSTGHSRLDHSKCQWELHTAARDAAEHYVVGRLPSVDLVGHTHGNISGPPTCRYAIGVLDQGTGKLRYAEVQAGQIVRVEPQARCIQYGATGEGASESALDRDKQLALNRRLVDAFGSTRRKRQLKQRDNAQVQVGAIGASDAVAELLQTAGNSAVAAGATKPEIMEKALGYRVLPPHNPEATRAQDAYKMTELEPRDVWNVLETHTAADLLQTAEDKGDGSVPEFIQQCWRDIKDVKSGEGKQTMKSIAYMMAAFNLYTGPNSVVSNPMRGGLTNAASRLDIQAEVMQSFVDYFYDAAERDGATIYSKSDQKKTLLLMHVLMAALILQGFNLGVKRCEQLRQAVKLTPTQFSALYREMGCVVKSAAVKGVGASVSPARDLTVTLLPPSSAPHLPAKKLADYFPVIKAGSKRGRG